MTTPQERQRALQEILEAHVSLSSTAMGTMLQTAESHRRDFGGAAAGGAVATKTSPARARVVGSPSIAVLFSPDRTSWSTNTSMRPHLGWRLVLLQDQTLTSLLNPVRAAKLARQAPALRA